MLDVFTFLLCFLLFSLFLLEKPSTNPMKKCVYFLSFHLQLLLFSILFWPLCSAVCASSLKQFLSNSVYTQNNLLSSNEKYFRLKYLGYMINNEMDDGFFYIFIFNFYYFACLFLTITVALVVKVVIHHSIY